MNHVSKLTNYLDVFVPSHMTYGGTETAESRRFTLDVTRSG